MKKLKIILLFTILCLQTVFNNQSFAQCLPMVKIDGNDLIADETNSSGIKLPSWLKAGQTLAKGQNVFSIAVIEFTVNGTTLDYSQNISVTTIQTVPAGKVWKIESIHKDPAITPSTTTYTTAGSYSFSPTCTGTYRIKVWGAGGGGAGGENACASIGGGGGGGGGYAEGSFFLFAGTSYTVVVGAGGTAGSYASSSAAGTGGTSSVSVIGVSATGGSGGLGWCTAPGGSGGLGSGGQTNAAGQVGSNGVNSGGGGSGGTGGTGAGGGGIGGNGVTSGGPGGVGIAPGGGGGGSGYAWGQVGGAGGAGKVEISLGGTGASTSRVPCVVLYQHSSSNCSSTSPSPCPAGWTDAGCGLISSGAYCRTCYRCD